MTGPLDLRAARRRYVTACVLFWLPLGLAVAGFFVAHSLAATALELPTGGLCDVLGRRTVLASAGLLNLAAFTLQGLGTSSWALTLGMALMGAGRALSSGPAEAWYVDAVQAHSGPDAELRTGLARGGTAISVALATGTLVGGALPWLLGRGPDIGARLSEATSGLIVPLSVPPLLGAVAETVFVLYVLTALPEPPRQPSTLRAVLRSIPVTVADGLRLGARDALVRRILLSAGAAGSALTTVELLAPGRAAAFTGAPESGAMLFAALACAGFVCSGIGSHLAPLAARFTGSGERVVLVSLGVSASGLLLLGATAVFTGAVSMGFAAAGYGLVYFGLGAAGPSENELLHRRVASTGRATALRRSGALRHQAARRKRPASSGIGAGRSRVFVGIRVAYASGLLDIDERRESERNSEGPGKCC
ncbi:MFS transporter [Streptomyces olivoreticuli]|uniref:MFS transporter n=1 Tax=Streptomyces olivoreticuli TaxID=68246 RepID=UPI001966E428|nr:MFS transporter [Streptomyces olivoreticuli]